MSEQQVTAGKLAERVGIDAKELRKWLRAEGLGAGEGKRYAFTSKQASDLARKFKAAQGSEADES